MGIQHWTNDHKDWYRNTYLKSEHWASLRAEKLKQNPACQKCGCAELPDVHHLRYKQIFDVTPSDLLTVCRKCHAKIHEVEGMPVRPRPNFNQMSSEERKRLRLQIKKR